MLRLVGWNALFLVAGLSLIGVAGETYFRLRTPFVENVHPYVWSPTVGSVLTPNAEVRHTNGLDFWTISAELWLAATATRFHRASSSNSAR